MNIESHGKTRQRASGQARTGGRAREGQSRQCAIARRLRALFTAYHASNHRFDLIIMENVSDFSFRPQRRVFHVLDLAGKAVDILDNYLDN